MQTIKQSKGGIEYLIGKLKEGDKIITRVIFWKIPHKTKEDEVALKIGRYEKKGFIFEVPESASPRSELTLGGEEFQALLDFLHENYEPFKLGIKKYIPIDEKLDLENINHLKAIFDNKDKHKVLDFIAKNNILPDELIPGIQYIARVKAINKFEEMLKENLSEHDWQRWFKDNDWVLGSEFVRILDERGIDTDNIADYLMQAYDGFVDIIEIKKPSSDINFWHSVKDHNNYTPSQDLIKAITQSTKYIYEVEREANSIKFLERVGQVKTIKPRCVLIFGRSDNWDDSQKEGYRILNSSYHNLTILTYDHVLSRAKRILQIS